MNPAVIRSIPDVRSWVKNRKQGGARVGCVPTMGALHAGHARLMEWAHRQADAVVVTIFVNPIQFDRKEDYEAYARTLPADLELCGKHNVAAVFVPSMDEMYPSPADTFVEVPDVSSTLCGAFRPGHFRGVATVVAKLFHIVQPDQAYFGEKDAQQLAVIRRMVAGLNFPVEIIGVPTVRESDGLALSSRNQRLQPEERAVAPLLYRALQTAESLIAQGSDDAEDVTQRARATLAGQPAIRLEYLELVDPHTLQPVSRLRGPVLAAVAAWIGGTRLIDNVLCLAP
ncbi:MAG TPA: pantoate--beta-alanine ligase [Bryobacteraceae bacterium]|nr:pantoate--beta-alanine ligase [Bryobacteraceae bacterium]